jgi:hypothetical protein
VAFAQEPNVDTMLRDAAYVFNRYEEATTGFDAEVDSWKTFSDSTKQSMKDNTRKIRSFVELEKPELNSLLGKKKVPTSALFDVYEELLMVTDDLDSMSTNSVHFGNTAVGLDMSKLSAKARELGTDISIALRSQIADQEEQLAACSARVKSPARK